MGSKTPHVSVRVSSLQLLLPGAATQYLIGEARNRRTAHVWQHSLCSRTSRAASLLGLPKLGYLEFIQCWCRSICKDGTDVRNPGGNQIAQNVLPSVAGVEYPIKERHYYGSHVFGDTPLLLPAQHCLQHMYC